MSTATPATGGPIEIHYQGGKVVVTPEDQDRFVWASCQAVSPGESELVRQRFADDFRQQFIARLHNWCVGHRAQVAGCYIPFGPNRESLTVFMLRRSPRFDLPLSDALAELELDLDGAGWPCDILQLPAGTPEELCAFFDPKQSIQVFANGDSASARGEG